MTETYNLEFPEFLEVPVTITIEEGEDPVAMGEREEPVAMGEQPVTTTPQP